MALDSETRQEARRVIRELKSKVNQMERDHEDMYGASWNYQEGVLISGSDAKAVVLYVAHLESKESPR